ncbi:hypothetical protein EDC04DRAFT_2605961 [Pisolithus marmoratus]|nr:hypothetical protein EDC04DRAFT_2605961 [Pisolithus marmoratus]
MSEQQQQKVRFYHQVDIVPISPCPQSRTALDLPEQMDTQATISSPRKGPLTPARCGDGGGVEFGGYHGLDSTPNNQSLSFRENEPPSPVHERVPSPQQDMDIELTKSFGNTAVGSPSPTPDLSLFERMKCAQVPKPPSPVPAPQMDLFERMQCTQPPPPPLPELHIEQGVKLDRGQSIDFGEPDRGWLQDLFKNGLMGDLPTEDERWDLQHAGLANADTKDDGSLVGQYTVDMIDLLEVSWYPHAGHDIQPYTGRPPYPFWQSVIEMAIIYWGLQIECAWFDNLCLDLKELDHLLLVTVLQESFMPTLPACFHIYLQCQDDKDRFQDDIWNIPLGAFQMINSLNHYIPEWTPRMPNKYAGFIFPWWLHGALKYPTDFQKLRGGRIYPIADEYFQYKWPAKNSSMGDQIDDWIEGKVHTYMTHLWDIAEQIELNEWDLNHLCSQWAALTRLIGM